MALPYYLTMYGDTGNFHLRISPRVRSAADAADFCWGATQGVTTLIVTGTGWRYLTNGRKRELQDQLEVLHIANIAREDARRAGHAAEPAGA